MATSGPGETCWGKAKYVGSPSSGCFQHRLEYSFLIIPKLKAFHQVVYFRAATKTDANSDSKDGHSLGSGSFHNVQQARSYRCGEGREVPRALCLPCRLGRRLKSWGMPHFPW